MSEMSFEYKSYEKRTPDFQYQNLLKDILENGVRDKSQTGTDTITRMGTVPMRFRLDNGFPVITERSIKGFWRAPIGELFAFINGARTLEKLEEFGCSWWDSWASPEKCTKRGLEAGDLGPGSYGAAFHDFPTSEGESFNQFKYLVQQIKEKPHLKTHIVTPFIPQYIYRVEGRQQKVVVVPCHGLLHIRIIDNKLTLAMWQRSGDVPIGVPSNMVQYAALTMALAHVTGYEPYEYIHTISDAHIYVDQVDAVKEVISREPRAFPTVTMNTEKNDLFAFRKEDFELSDYDPHPPIKGIPVAV